MNSIAQKSGKNIIKINWGTPETKKKLVNYFKDSNIFYHT